MKHIKYRRVLQVMLGLILLLCIVSHIVKGVDLALFSGLITAVVLWKLRKHPLDHLPGLLRSRYEQLLGDRYLPLHRDQHPFMNQALRGPAADLPTELYAHHLFESASRRGVVIGQMFARLLRLADEQMNDGNPAFADKLLDEAARIVVALKPDVAQQVVEVEKLAPIVRAMMTPQRYDKVPRPWAEALSAASGD